MKFRFGMVAAVLVLAGLQANGQEQTQPCFPLNETISVCTDIDGLDVAFFGGTGTSYMGTVDLSTTEDMYFGWFLIWASDSTLESIAREQTRDFAADYGQHELQDPVSVVVEGFPGIRYDMLADSAGGRELPPKMLLFLDTGGGIAMFYGDARQPSVSPDDLFSGARNAARILKRAE